MEKSQLLKKKLNQISTWKKKVMTNLEVFMKHGKTTT